MVFSDNLITSTAGLAQALMLWGLPDFITVAIACPWCLDALADNARGLAPLRSCRTEWEQERRVTVE